MIERAGEAVGIGIAGAGALGGFQVAEDHGEKIVEVVRHTAGELADALHLLRLGELLLRALQVFLRLAALGDVACDLDEADQFAAGIADRIQDDAGPETRAVLADPVAFRLELALLVRRP